MPLTKVITKQNISLGKLEFIWNRLRNNQVMLAFQYTIFNFPHGRRIESKQYRKNGRRQNHAPLQPPPLSLVTLNMRKSIIEQMH